MVLLNDTMDTNSKLSCNPTILLLRTPFNFLRCYLT